MTPKRVKFAPSFQIVNRLTMITMPKFSNTPHSFHTELKKRISAYFEELGKSTTGNYKLAP